MRPSHCPGNFVIGACICWLMTSMVCVANCEEPKSSDLFTPVKIKSEITSVQPMTGIVFWHDRGEANSTDAIQLEYSYIRYEDIATSASEYDWGKVEQILAAAANRGHQSIIRFFYVYPGKETAVPRFIKSADDYSETHGKSEGKKTGFADWTSQSLQDFTLDFYTRFAKRYDDDPRLAVLQTGFGLWGEYHIYSGPRKMGKTFPSKEFQKTFLQHMAKTFTNTSWMISIDAADGSYSPFESEPDYKKLHFGLFDDSFLCKPHPKENAMNWKFFGDDHWQHSPHGGEFSYYNNRDQKQALAPNGPNGVSFRELAAKFHITFMIGNNQPSYQSMDRIREASMAVGYRLRLTRFESSKSESKLTFTNEGIAPLYVDAYPAIAGVRATQSFKGLLPGETREFTIAVGRDDLATAADLKIESDAILKQQKIEFAASLD